MKAVNLRMLEFIASKLENLCNDLVFLGGCATAALITDPSVPEVRATFDVDCIVDAISQSEYYKIEKKLRDKGFKQSHNDDIICRWHYDDMILDVMPTDEKILGFGNRWYKSAIKHTITYSLTENISINVVSSPYFFATKLEAFHTRGNSDFMASHDFEDIVSVLDGRANIIYEIIQSEYEVKEYLQSTFKEFINNRAFWDSLPGHFSPYGNLMGDRIKLLKNNLDAIIGEKI
ncbi:MAG: hypothetical protein AB7D28_11460 [Candidatus Berkiella sp.]